MKIIWTDFAANSLLEIYQFYKESASINIAFRIRSRIFNATRQLVNHPLSGQLEPNLIRLNEEHRYLVEGNYKIIYKRVKEGVLYSAIPYWPYRQRCGLIACPQTMSELNG